jgi:hypothetical protein
MNISKFDASFVTYILCPLHIQKYAKRKFQADHIVVRFGKYQDSHKNYNKLLLKAKFYRYFDQYKYILIMQSDAYINNVSALQCFIQSDLNYAGARFEAFDDKVVGNGGLSLRKVSYFLDITEKKQFYVPKSYQQRSFKWYILAKIESSLRMVKYFYLNGKINEDVIWSLFVVDRSNHINEIGGLKFSVEKVFQSDTKINSEFVFGYHAWQKYQPLDMQQRIKDQLNAI